MQKPKARASSFHRGTVPSDVSGARLPGGRAFSSRAVARLWGRRASVAELMWDRQFFYGVVAAGLFIFWALAIWALLRVLT